MLHEEATPLRERTAEPPHFHWRGASCRGNSAGPFGKGALDDVRGDAEPEDETGKEPKMPSDAVQCKPLEVVVSDRGIERAIKMLKRKLASEGVLRELKMRRHYMKPSVKRRKKQAEAARRRRKRAKLDAAPPKG